MKITYIFLSLYFFLILSAFNKLNKSIIIKSLFLLHNLNFKSFFRNFLEIFKLLLTIFEANKKKIFSIGKKKPKIKYAIFNISN